VESFIYVALGLIGLGAFFLLRTIAFLRGAVATQGTVVDMESHSGEHGPTYTPVVEYLRPDGQPQRFTEEGSSSHPGVQVDDTVPVKFDPERPEKARINRPFRLWGAPVFFFLLGAVFLVASQA
jgi:hypothetical protein